MRVLGGHRDGDFFNHRGRRGALGELIGHSGFTPEAAAPRIAALQPAAAAVEVVPAEAVIPEPRAQVTPESGLAPIAAAGDLFGQDVIIDRQ